jgi:predicted Zn-dependent protease
MIMLKPYALIRALVVFALVSCSFTSGSSDKTAADIIRQYQTGDVAAQVRSWQEQITHPSGNPKFKEYQAERLKEWEASEFAQYRLDDPQLTSLVAEVIAPVLRLYRRENCFKILLIDHPAPIAMNDSGVLLMFSTGLLARATSDDDLLGHTAHELGHDLFWRRTAAARQIIALHRMQGVGTDLTERQACEELIKIELECDAFSAVTLASLGRSPLPTVHSLEAVEHDYPDFVRRDLPPAAVRAKVIEGVVPAEATHVAPQTSEAFKRLKALLASRKHQGGAKPTRS